MLGRRDLVLLFVVAVFNLNVLPSIAANGGVTIWLWIISLTLFFWPQGIAVIELAHRYPGEGGVYLWAKEVFGDWHGFLSGWCYWTNNMMYVPTVMLYFVGVSVFVLGPSHVGLADNKTFALVASVVLLSLLVILNVMGLGVGKWVNNLGGIGTFVAAFLLMGLGVVVCLKFGTSIRWEDFKIPTNPKFVLNSFGVICFGLVGLELASIMGDEIENPRKVLPGAVAWGGLLSGLLYLGATLTLLIAVDKGSMSVLQGIVQAVNLMAAKVHVPWIVIPFAFLLSVSIAGIGSAWLGGSARIPFVAGLDSYMPAWLGKSSPKICDTLCGADCPRVGFVDSCDSEFCRDWWRAGILPVSAFTCGCAAVDSIPVYVRCFTQDCICEGICPRPLRERNPDFCRCMRFCYNRLGHSAGFFSRPADQVPGAL